MNPLFYNLGLEFAELIIEECTRPEPTIDTDRILDIAKDKACQAHELIYVRKREFDCPCCSGNWISLALVEKLNRARNIAKIPFVISSGCRCNTYNAENGYNAKSDHVYGVGADIKCHDSKSRLLIVSSLLSVGFERIGIYDRHIHASTHSEKPPAIWTGKSK